MTTNIINDIEGEIWKEIPGFNGRYEASTFGRIRSRSWKRTNGKCVVLTNDKSSKYYRVRILENGIPGNKGKNYLVHRLVGITFIENPNNHYHMNHKNGDRSNNSVSNLEWCTDSYNVLHSYDTGLNAYIGEKSHKCVIRSSDLPTIFKMRSEGHTMQAIADVVGSEPSNIYRILAGKYRRRETVELRKQYGFTSYDALKHDKTYSLASSSLKAVFEMYAEGKTLCSIAKLMGVSAGQIGCIVSGKSRAHETIELRKQYCSSIL